MPVEAWLARFGAPIDAAALQSEAAAALVRFVHRHAGHLAQFINAYRDGDLELVVLDFQTGRPQRPAYPIKRTERLGVLFSASDSLPLIYMLRDDFPDTEHQQLALEGAPRAICVDDRSWAEARLTWTPAEMIQRILSWFSRASNGTLHDARQPLDPVLFGSYLSLIVSRAVLRDSVDLDLIGVHDPNYRQMLRVIPLEPGRVPVDRTEPICIFGYQIPPEHMRRMTFAPGNLGSLTDMLRERGVDLLSDMKARISGWLDQGLSAAWRLNSRFIVIVEMPIVAPNGQQRDGSDVRAYITDRSAGDIAVALGIAHKQERDDEGSKVGYVKAVPAAEPDQDVVRQIVAQAAEVHLEFDRTLATQLTGRRVEDARKAVLVGAGAIGSHISDCLVREGRFEWTVIDHDRLLPHNLGRHTARGGDVTRFKAEIVAKAAVNILEGAAPVAAITANIITHGPERADIDNALNAADLIIDATASVLAERFLSDHPAKARRVSTFFNPAGTAAVLLAEPADRSLTLRDIEAQYLGQLVTQAPLAGHLGRPEGDYAYTGACRAITTLIPESRVMALSGLVSAGLGEAIDQDAGLVRIWSMQEKGGVEIFDFTPEPVSTFSAGDWSVSVDFGLITRIRAMRAEKLPNETGGVLLGVVDIPNKSIHLVEALPAPPDSTGTAAGFTRGTQGVQEALDHALDKTLGQVRYVGEWHSHPPRSGAMPSATDLVQIDWLAALFDMDILPALMLIAADNETSVILANQQSVAQDGKTATQKKAAGGTG